MIKKLFFTLSPLSEVTHHIGGGKCTGGCTEIHCIVSRQVKVSLVLSLLLITSCQKRLIELAV